MEAIARSGEAVVTAVADISSEATGAAAAIVPGAAVVEGLEGILANGVDGVVIATPSALHSEQAIATLERGAAVFCQKPLGRTAAEARQVVEVARQADRLLGVDLSYRGTRAANAVRDIVRSGELGTVYAVDLVFHNAYGPDKAWFRDPALSGGGCVADLGIHLVDLAMWTLGFPGVRHVTSRLFASGVPVSNPPQVVEDYAIARLDLDDGAVVRLACSWNLSAGCDAVIESSFYGARGGAAMRNVNGSFYDFVAERYSGTAREQLVSPPDAWGGRAAVEWARKLADGARYDSAVEEVECVSEVLDRIYGR